MFLNIREQDVRAHCPEYAPMTIKMFNKLNPLKQNNSVNPLNPFTERRTPPSSINQFVKTSGYQFSRSASEAGALMDRLVSSVETSDILQFEEDVEFLNSIGITLPNVPEPTPDPAEDPTGVEEIEVIQRDDGSFGFDDGGGG